MSIDSSETRAEQPAPTPSGDSGSSGSSGFSGSSGPSWLKGAGWLGISVLALSVSNYVFSLSMTRLLPNSAFVEYVGVQSLLLVIGTGVMAAVPWVMAREVARARAAPDDERDRILGDTLGFGLLAAAAQGLVVAAVAGVVGHGIGGFSLGATAATAAFAISMVAAPVGLLQGLQRFKAIAGLRIAEGGIRIGFSLLLVVLVTASAEAAIVGMTIGSTALVVAGLLLGGRGLRVSRPRGSRLGQLVGHAVRLGSIQILLTFVASIDAVVAALTSLSPDAVYAYQTASLLGRAPLFVALALAQALYPVLVAASSEADRSRELRRAVGVYLRIGLVVVVAALTVPELFLAVLVGDAAAPAVTDLLRPTALSGVLVGLAVLMATVLQARDRLARLLVLLVVTCVAQPVLLLGASRLGAEAFAVTGTAVIAAMTLAVAWMVRDTRPFADRGLRFWVPFLVAVPLTAALLLLEHHPVVWAAVLAAGAAHVLQHLSPPRRPVRRSKE